MLPETRSTPPCASHQQRLFFHRRFLSYERHCLTLGSTCKYSVSLSAPTTRAGKRKTPFSTALRHWAGQRSGWSGKMGPDASERMAAQNVQDICVGGVEGSMLGVWTGRCLPVYSLNNLWSQAARLRDWISISLIFPVLVYLFHYTHSLISILAERSREWGRQGGREGGMEGGRKGGREGVPGLFLPTSPPSHLQKKNKKTQGKKKKFVFLAGRLSGLLLVSAAF